VNQTPESYLKILIYDQVLVVNSLCAGHWGNLLPNPANEDKLCTVLSSVGGEDKK